MGVTPFVGAPGVTGRELTGKSLGTERVPVGVWSLGAVGLLGEGRGGVAPALGLSLSSLGSVLGVESLSIVRWISCWLRPWRIPVSALLERLFGGVKDVAKYKQWL